MATKIVTNKIDQLKERLIEGFGGKEYLRTDWGTEVREKAEDHISQLSIPTTKWEAWKYTSLKDVLTPSYKPVSSDFNSQINPKDFEIPHLEVDKIVFINGKFQADASDIRFQENQIQVKSFTELTDADKEKVGQYYGSIIDPTDNIFTALNTAYSEEGVLIHITEGFVTKRPIHIMHIVDLSPDDLSIHHRNLFLAGKHSQATVLETFHTVKEVDKASLRILGTEIKVEENANLTYIKLQLAEGEASQIDTTEAVVERNARFDIQTITLNGKLTRNNLHIHLNGQNGESHLMGAYLIDEIQHVDNFTQVDHAVPHCYSNELYKGIIHDRATAVFNGRIHVHPQAQKTNAFQSNRNIILSDNARIFTKPQLEIYADDVKCSHGATTGRLDKDALFYLRARGIKEQDAKMLLIYAFATEVTNQIAIEPLREFVADLISARFSKGISL